MQKKLKKSNINIVANDIQYKEGILEYLDESIDINYLIIDDKLPGEINTEELIEQIKDKNKRIKVILITDKSEQKIKVHRKVKKFDLMELSSIINEETSYTHPYLSLEVKKKNKDGKIITILGPNGIGKSIFAVTLAQSIKDKKVLIIDFDMLNNNIHLLLGVKNYSKKIKQGKTLRAEKTKNNKNNIIEYNFRNKRIREENFLECTIQTKYKIDLLPGVNLISYLTKAEVQENIKNIRKQYDVIIIDTSNNYMIENTKDIVDNSDKIIFISGANVLEVKKSRKLLSLYENEWNIKRDKINIIFNKYTKQSIDKEILKNIFRDYHILGNLKLGEYFDKAININNIKIKEIQKELQQIRENIQKEKRKVNGIK